MIKNSFRVTADGKLDFTPIWTGSLRSYRLLLPKSSAQRFAACYHEKRAAIACVRFDGDVLHCEVIRWPMEVLWAASCSLGGGDLLEVQLEYIKGSWILAALIRKKGKLCVSVVTPQKASTIALSVNDVGSSDGAAIHIEDGYVIVTIVGSSIKTSRVPFNATEAKFRQWYSKTVTILARKREGLILDDIRRESQINIVDTPPKSDQVPDLFGSSKNKGLDAVKIDPALLQTHVRIVKSNGVLEVVQLRSRPENGSHLCTADLVCRIDVATGYCVMEKLSPRTEPVMKSSSPVKLEELFLLGDHELVMTSPALLPNLKGAKVESTSNLSTVILERFFNDLNEAEKQHVINHPLDSLVGAYYAWQAGEKFGGWNDGSDAARHATWAAAMTAEIGADAARQILNNHESSPDQSATERAMDNYNNEVGIAIGLANPGLSFAQLAEKVAAMEKAGYLMTPTNPNPKTFPGGPGSKSSSGGSKGSAGKGGRDGGDHFVGVGSHDKGNAGPKADGPKADGPKSDGPKNDKANDKGNQGKDPGKGGGGKISGGGLA